MTLSNRSLHGKNADKISISSVANSRDNISKLKINLTEGGAILKEETNIEPLFSIRENLDILKILLKDRTTNKNIIWASDNYYSINPKDNMKVSMISNGGSLLIKPRVEKSLESQSNRTKERAEVFTPTWIVEKQNNIIEKEFKNLPLLDYVNKIWLEITCGEGPYMTSRYDTVTGNHIPLTDRVGFVDRKLQRISSEIDNHDEWLDLAIKAYKASYGYEFHGDSLLIARENLLYTFIEYYESKFDKVPDVEIIKEISKIISYNIFQMDGLKYIIPYSEEAQTKIIHTQLSLFDDIDDQLETVELIERGIDVKIKDWDLNKILEFKKIVRGGINL